jgi:hypothetical protein
MSFLMRSLSRFALPLFSLCLLILLHPEAVSFADSSPAGRWIGQDGRDFVGKSPTPGPSDVQDVRIALSGLPPKRIVFASVVGEGGGEADYGGSGGHWRAKLVRASDRAETADLYFEPYQPETGRSFSVTLRFEDGGSVAIAVKGGAADPNLRMPGAKLRAEWKGQGGRDFTGPTSAVGPDGFQDVRIALSGLSKKREIESATLILEGRPLREFGLNPDELGNAELIRRGGDSSRADFYFSPTEDLSGRKLVLTLRYAGDQADSDALTGGATRPRLAMPRPALRRLHRTKLDARWRGQKTAPGASRGWIRLSLGHAPGGKVVFAALSDPYGGFWTFPAPKPSPDEEGFKTLPLSVRPSGKGRFDLLFPPFRDENGSRMTVRLRYSDGRDVFSMFVGGPCDPYLQGEPPRATAVVARPGDDLNALADRYGTVTLSPGTYALDRPLVLARPVRLIGHGDATLRFSQPPSAPTWSAAVKIHRSNTRLEGFAIRFAGPVRWTPNSRYGPAVIGSTDEFDPPMKDPKTNVSILRLDVEGPPIPPGAPLEEAPRSIRMATATSGRIIGDRLKGGVTDVVGGPWRIEANDYRGAAPGSFAYDTFATHYSHDVTVARNRVHPVGPHGKTWRFLVKTQIGLNDAVLENVVDGVGPRDDDSIPNPNAAETFLTEAYRLHFEGKPADLSPDGYALTVPLLQGPPARTGDVVSILSGPRAGEWRRIAQAVDPKTYLLDAPLRSKEDAISIGTGFVDNLYARNRIDCRGSSTAGDLILAGNHYNTRILDNVFYGGGDAFRLLACPTERPVIWGWSHAPFLGARLEGNRFEDTLKGGTIDVERSRYVKTGAGRVYMTLKMERNEFRWTAPFLARLDAKLGDPERERWAATVGNVDSRFPGELVLKASGNRLEEPEDSRVWGALRVDAAEVNGRILRRTALKWPVAGSK